MSASPVVTLESVKVELQRRLDQAFHEYLRDPRRGGPDHMGAYKAWRERQREVQAWFAGQIKQGGDRDET